MKPLPNALLCLVLGLPGFACAETALTARELDDRITDLTPLLVAATVGIMIEGAGGGAGAGSGVIVTPEGLIMTAAHVTGSPGKTFTVLLSDGRQVTAVSLGALMGGSVITESVFALNGVGFLAFKSILRADFPVVQSIIVSISCIYICLTLISDLLNAQLDPRIRLG